MITLYAYTLCISDRMVYNKHGEPFSLQQMNVKSVPKCVLASSVVWRL